MVPTGALVIRSNGVQVVVVEPASRGKPATIHFRSVQVLRDYGGTVEIADGVIDGTTVVLNPNADLQDGARVRVIAATPAAGSGTSVPK